MAGLYCAKAWMQDSMNDSQVLCQRSPTLSAIKAGEMIINNTFLKVY